MAYSPKNVTEPVDVVRLLISDVGQEPIFTDSELGAFLTLESDSIKRAAAAALDTIASDEALTSKVLKDQNLQTDGAKTADALRAHATALRAQAREDEASSEGGFFLDIIPDSSSSPELVPNEG